MTQRRKRHQVQRWHFIAYFEMGESYIHTEVGTTEEEVRALLDEKYYGGNWKRDSLRKGKKYKVPVNE